MEPDRFRGAHDGFPGHWWSPPQDWHDLPQEALDTHETLRVIMRAIDELPQAQRTVIVMRDVEGCAADEVCAALDVTDANQRILLHRARSRVRSALERHLDAQAAGAPDLPGGRRARDGLPRGHAAPRARPRRSSST